MKVRWKTHITVDQVLHQPSFFAFTLFPLFLIIGSLRLILLNRYCTVHERITIYEIERYPGAIRDAQIPG